VIGKIFKKKKKRNWAPVVHACNPNYSGGRDRGLKPARASSSREPVLKKTHHKKELVEWLMV
jgi:hypothetical protein